MQIVLVTLRIFVKVNLRYKNWLFSGSCNPNVGFVQNRTLNLNKHLDSCSSKHEKFIVIGDVSAEMTNYNLEEFCASYNFKNLITEPTCFINLENPTGINHILTNYPKGFRPSGIYETGLSDVPNLTLTVLKIFQSKHKSKIIQYRDLNHFDNALFRAAFLQELSLENFCPREFEKLNMLSKK